MATYRVLVTGSRTWTSPAVVLHALREASKLNTQNWPVTLIHGGARGLDTMAAGVARRMGWNVEEHLAHWHIHSFEHSTHPCPAWHAQLEKCAMAGHRRNSDMVRTRADICLAFIKDESAGATGCAKLAERAGIPTEYYRVTT